MSSMKNESDGMTQQQTNATSAQTFRGGFAIIPDD